MVPSVRSLSRSSNDDYAGSGTGNGVVKVDEVSSLVSFNHFGDAEESDRASGTHKSIFQQVKRTFSAPLSSFIITAASPVPPQCPSTSPAATEKRHSAYQNSILPIRYCAADRSCPIPTVPAQAAPPLVTLAQAQSKIPSFGAQYNLSLPCRDLLHSPTNQAVEAERRSIVAPASPQDDVGAITITTSLRRSVSNVMRRLLLGGEGLFSPAFPS